MSVSSWADSLPFIPPVHFIHLPKHLQPGPEGTLVDTEYDVWLYWMFRDHLHLVDEKVILQKILVVKKQILEYNLSSPI